MTRSVGIHPIKFVVMQTLGETGCMHNIVKGVGGKLLFERFLRREVKRNEVNTCIGEIGFRTAFAHSRPYFHAAP